MADVTMAAARMLASLRAAWRAALASWRDMGEREKQRDKHESSRLQQIASVPQAQAGTPEERRASWFDIEPGTFTLPLDEEEAEAEAWVRAHFRQGWPRQ
jgi:hypothetical protein